MANITQIFYKMFILDELADKKTAIHRVNPAIKVIITLIYLLLVVSYNKYDITGMIPLFFYPVIIMAAGEIPIKVILGGILLSAPLVIGVGIFNPLLDRTIAATLAGVSISAGMLSFISLLIKCSLTVSAAILLLATTGINKIAAALLKLHIPQIFITQLLLTYRYIFVLMEEATNVNNAYSLRASYQTGVRRDVWGSLIGSLLLRTYDRAVRLYQAMKLRGFENHYFGVESGRILKSDLVYFLGWTAFFLIARFINITEILGLLVTGVNK